jgi:DinB superfamily
MPATIDARPAADEYAPYYSSYISLVPAGDLIRIADRQVAELSDTHSSITAEQWRFRYAPGKWSILQMLGHLIDTERVFMYRAMSFASQDGAALPSFDQDRWVASADYDARDPDSLLAEWSATRRASLAFMAGLPAPALDYRGTASDVEFTVRAAMHIPIGHVSYHLAGLRRDYLSALR